MMAGALRHPLTYLEPTETVGDTGQVVPDWSTPAVSLSLWGEVRTPTGREAFIAQTLRAVVTHVVIVRYHPSIAIRPVGRIVDSVPQLGSPGGIYSIVAAVDEDGRRRTLKLYAAEVVSPDATNSSNL